MTDKQRDDLLISLVKSFNEFRIENREEHKRLEETLRAEMKQTADDLRTEMRQTADDLRAEMKQTAYDLRAEINQVAKNSSKEIKESIEFNNIGIREMFHDVWTREAKKDQKLKEHDFEIKKLKEKLA